MAIVAGIPPALPAWFRAKVMVETVGQTADLRVTRTHADRLAGAHVDGGCRFKPAEEIGNIFPDTWFVIYAR